MWATIAVISLIISTALSVDLVAAQRIAKDKRNKIAQKAAKLQKEMAQDSNLIAQLLDAYNRRDAKLANDIIYSSPFGSRFAQIKQEIKQTKEKIDELTNEQRLQANERARVESELSKAESNSQTSGSVIGDLVAGGISKVKSNLRGYTSDPTKDVQYNPSNTYKEFTGGGQ